MSEKRDYYEVLGLSKNASTDEIKKAYRKLALKYHPDKGGTKEDETKFKEINEAYQTLSDPQKKQAYDQFGHAGPRMGGGQGGFDWGQYQQGFSSQGFNINMDDLGGIGDIFEMFTGGSGRSRRPQRGSDIQATISIDFSDIISGVEKELNLEKYNVCDRCKGDGAEPGSGKKTCPTCKGSGQLKKEQHTMFGTFAQMTTCDTCGGVGKIPEKPCTKCSGQGRVKEEKSIKVKIPAGIDDGQTIRVEGQGEAGQIGVPPGDLYLNIRIRPDKRFHREGSNIFSDTKISFPKAALGTTVDVETVSGSVSLKIPSGTQSGKVFRLTERGLPKLHSSKRGDHFVTVTVETPTKLSGKQKKLLEEFENDKSWF